VGRKESEAGGNSPKETIMRTAVFVNFLILIVAAFALAQVAPEEAVAPAAAIAPATAVAPEPIVAQVPAVATVAPMAPAATVTVVAVQIAQSAPPAPPVQAVPAAPAAPAAPVVRVSGSYLGIDPDDVTHDNMGQLRLSEPRGVEITTVDQDSPAGKAGLREQDVILSFNGQQVSNSRDLRKFIRQTPPGQTVKLGISRDGQMQTVPVQLADRKQTFNFHFNIPPIAPMPPMNFPEPPVINVMQRRSGLTVESLSGQLAQYFGTKSGRGVLVRSVDHGSNAEAAGFKAGDVIIAAGNSSVDNVSDWSRVLRQQNGKVSVKVLRDRREQTLSFNVPDRSRSDASGAFTMPDMGEINKQLAALRPEIERETARAQEEVKREMELHHKEMEQINSERVKAEMERLRPEIERDIARAQKEAERAMQLNQKDLQKQMEEMRKQLEKSLQDMQDHDEQ
jgi:membrane-associated protease RseP (regulator of RpoE activity)